MNEEEVLKTKKKCETLVIIGGIMIGLSFILFIPTMGVTMITFIGGGVLVGLTLHKFEKLSTEYKSTYVKDTLKDLIPGAKFDATGGFYQDEVLSSRLIPRTDRFHSEDYLYGKFLDFPFFSSDVIMENVHHDKNGTHTTTIFKGRFYRIDFPNDFKTDFVVLQPSLGLKWFYNDLKNVETESINFNATLKVFAKDELTVREIITPPFMERLMIIDEKYKDKIALSFLGNHLYVAINSYQDPFDLRLFHPLNTSYMNEIKQEMAHLHAFLDLINL